VNRENLFLVLIATAMNAMTPLLFAAVGGLFTELTGTLNIALEGLIITGAFFGAAAASVAPAWTMISPVVERSRITMCEVRLRMRLARPRARGLKRLIVKPSLA